MFHQENPQSGPYWDRGQLQQQDRQARHNGRWRPGHPKGPCPRLGVHIQAANQVGAKDVSTQGAVASVRVLRNRRAAGAGTPWAEALSSRAVSPCRRVSSHCTRHCGATATWRRVGSNRMSAQEARVDVFDEKELLKKAPSALRAHLAPEGRRSWDADTGTPSGHGPVKKGAGAVAA
jgi:hypothetical protein